MLWEQRFLQQPEGFSCRHGDRHRKTEHSRQCVSRNERKPQRLYAQSVFADELQCGKRLLSVNQKSVYDDCSYGIKDGLSPAAGALDLCLKVREQKKLVVYEPGAVLRMKDRKAEKDGIRKLRGRKRTETT